MVFQRALMTYLTCLFYHSVGGYSAQGIISALSQQLSGEKVDTRKPRYLGTLRFLAKLHPCTALQNFHVEVYLAPFVELHWFLPVKARKNKSAFKTCIHS